MLSGPVRTGKLLSYPNIVSTLALVVALSGSAYAVTQLPAKSVGTTQLQNGAVTSKKVRDGSLKTKDFVPGSILAPGSGVSSLTRTIKPCQETVLLSRSLVPRLQSRLLGISAGYWYANQSTGTATYELDSYLQVRQNGAIVGVTATQSSRSSAPANEKVPLGSSGVLLDRKTGRPTVLSPGKTYLLELVAHPDLTCVNNPTVGPTQLSYVLLADHG